jgi:hypothetical protein
MSHGRKEEYGKKLRRKGSNTTDGQVWLEDDPHGVRTYLENEDNNEAT